MGILLGANIPVVQAQEEKQPKSFYLEIEGAKLPLLGKSKITIEGLVFGVHIPPRCGERFIIGKDERVELPPGKNDVFSTTVLANIKYGSTISGCQFTASSSKDWETFFGNVYWVRGGKLGKIPLSEAELREVNNNKWELNFLELSRSKP